MQQPVFDGPDPLCPFVYHVNCAPPGITFPTWLCPGSIKRDAAVAAVADATAAVAAAAGGAVAAAAGDAAGAAAGAAAGSAGAAVTDAQRRNEALEDFPCEALREGRRVAARRVAVRRAVAALADS